MLNRRSLLQAGAGVLAALAGLPLISKSLRASPPWQPKPGSVVPVEADLHQYIQNWFWNAPASYVDDSPVINRQNRGHIILGRFTPTWEAELSSQLLSVCDEQSDPQIMVWGGLKPVNDCYLVNTHYVAARYFIGGQEGKTFYVKLYDHSHATGARTVVHETPSYRKWYNAQPATVPESWPCPRGRSTPVA